MAFHSRLLYVLLFEEGKDDWDVCTIAVPWAVKVGL
jgi:hypothetical protein